MPLINFSADGHLGFLQLFFLLQIKLKILVHISCEYSCSCLLGTFDCISLRHVILSHWTCFCSAAEDNDKQFSKASLSMYKAPNSIWVQGSYISPTLGLVRLLILVTLTGPEWHSVVILNCNFPIVYKANKHVFIPLLFLFSVWSIIQLALFFFWVVCHFCSDVLSGFFVIFR